MTERLDPELLERLRRGIPLHLDRLGQFSMEGDPISHPGVRALFLRGLDTSPAGEPTLHVGEQWCYLKVEDLPLRATAVRADERGAPLLRLDDGRELPLDPTTVWEEPGRGLRCSAPSQVSGRPLAVRFTNNALSDLGPWLEVDDATGAAALRVAGARAAIGASAPSGMS